MASTKKARVTLPADADILIIREFDAPPHLVWKAWTTPELIERWWGSQRGRVTSVEVDLRVGGAWRYEMDARGTVVAFRGEYREIEEPRRLVNTEIFESAPDAVSVITSTFEPIEDDRTRLEQLCSYPAREIRDMVIESGMEEGMQESMDALEEVVVRLAANG
ncbi:MAG: SRPBCC family protein [Solirubrobacterales bacterium]|nr:SRPBCC family protein [Solirubrobacterales bacterium]MCB8971047.1 SRPBCC family protein [Thermoleophilales bacterium]MCO5326059.1 SRPBCC family protein [Solirubrobacterales bacterium]